jgi:hypothetical protein
MSELRVSAVTDETGGNTATINGMTPTADSLQARFNEVFEYRDGALFWKVNTNKSKNLIGKQAGCTSSNTYGSVMIDKKSYCIHRVIFCMHTGLMPAQVDHKDGDRKNSRIENLRAATDIENKFNKGAQRNNKCGAKNVCWSSVHKKWAVQVQSHGKRVFSKLIPDFELAELVAHMAREKFHGAFANHGYKGAQA